ncbi:MAG: ATP-binding protein [Alphaproteobacteria bacterium]
MSTTATILAGVAAIVATSVAAWLYWRLLQSRKMERRRDVTVLGSESTLAASGMTVVIWPRGEAAASETYLSPDFRELMGLPDDSPATLGDIYGCFAEASANALADALEKLRADAADGAGFELTLHDRNGHPSWKAAGSRIVVAGGGQADLLSFRNVRDDISAISSLRAEILRMRTLLDAVPLPIWSRDANLGIEQCNLAYARAVEVETSEEALLGMHELAGSAAGNSSRVLARNALHSGIAQKAREHIVIDGARRYYEITEEPLDGTGKLAGFALDLTEIEEAQSELKRHIAAHREILEKLGTAIVIYGPDMRVGFFNKAYIDMWDFDEKWLHGGPLLGEVMDSMQERRLLPETADFPALKHEMATHFTTLTEALDELIHVPNGATLRRVIAPHPMGGLLYTYEDVTDRLALERSYNTLIDVQRESLDNLAEGITVYGGDGKLKLSNPVFAKMWGLTPSYLSGEPHISELLERVRPLFKTSPEWSMYKQTTIGMITGREEREGEIERADGLHLEYGMVPLPDGGMLVRYLDVTDSTRVERALRERTEALEQADKLKSEFIANVSYELRTPLNTIIGFTEILNNEYFGPLTPRQKEYSEGTLEASQHLLSLINDILELASIEAGRINLDVAPVDVAELVNSVHQLSREWARQQKVTLEVDVAGDLGPVALDEHRLKHALFNLVNNAIKFTPVGGRVALRVSRVGEQVHFVVADTGIGISEGERERVFDKFVRGRDADGRQVGFGLGLSLVKSLIELHGGSVSIRSAEGGGTIVTCTLPSPAGQYAAPGAAAPNGEAWPNGSREPDDKTAAEAPARHIEINA